MAQTELDKEFFKAGTSFDRPIPGQSLTNDPEAPAPFERAPKYTDKSQVLTYYFDLFTDEDNYGNILNALDEDISIMEIVKVFLFKGFEDGLFNPDMMLIVAEPLAYMIAALAERAGVDSPLGPLTISYCFRMSTVISKSWIKKESTSVSIMWNLGLFLQATPEISPV